jgi:addiction module HigA family antidote
MADRTTEQWAPQWTVTPGEILTEALEERGMSQAELARRMARPLKTISEIANGKASVTPDTAIQLERVLGISAGFWNGVEVRFRESIAQQRANEELDAFASWSSRFPQKAMIRHGLIAPERTARETTEDLLSFFKVSSPMGWERQWSRPAASLRHGSLEPDVHALSAWLRWGEREAVAVPTSTFDRDGVVKALAQVRPLTRWAMIDDAIDRLQAILADHGVVVLVVPELPGARVSGASYWLEESKAVAQLSWRYRSDDQFWFSVFHEIGHIVKDKKGRLQVEDVFEVGEEHVNSESAVDEFARDALIPSGAYMDFVRDGNFAGRSVSTFASELDIAAGIVVGRLQHDLHIGPSALNSLKRSYLVPE